MRRTAYSGVIAGITVFLVLILQMPGLANPGYMPFEDFDRSETKDYWFQVEAGLVTSELDGSFRLDPDAGDTKVDLEGVLQLEDDRNQRARVQFQPVSGTVFRFGYYGIEYQETTDLTTSITVDGKTYSASDRVDSLLQMDTYELGYNQNLFSSEYLSIGFMFQINGFDFKTRLDNETTGETVQEDGLAAVPYPGLRVEIFPIPYIGVYGEARYIAGSATVAGTSGTDDTDIDFSSSDLDAGVQLNLNPNYDVRLGYRRFNYELTVDKSELDLTSAGPYFTVGLRF